MRFVSPQGFNSSEQFFNYLKDAFNVLYEEGKSGQAKILSVGLHARIVGHPVRLAGLKRFLDYIQSKQYVWVARRIDIAKYWCTYFYPKEKDAYYKKRMAQIINYQKEMEASH